MYIDQTMNYTVIERGSSEAFFRLGELNCNLRSKVITPVTLFISNITLWTDFLQYFEETVDRYCATGKPICLLGDVNINILRAQTCNCGQQFLDCLQSYALLPIIDKLI